MARFDPYRDWLGIRDVPPDYYDLLGVARFEIDHDEIHRAADARKAMIRNVRPGTHIEQWQRLLDEIETARRCLASESERGDYDAKLRAIPISKEAVLEKRGEQAAVAESTMDAESEEEYEQRKQQEAGDDRRQPIRQPSANPLPPSLDSPADPLAELTDDYQPVESLVKNLLPPSLDALPQNRTDEVKSTSDGQVDMAAGSDSPGAAPGALEPPSIPTLGGTSEPTPAPPQTTPLNTTPPTTPLTTPLTATSVDDHRDLANRSLSELLPPTASVAPREPSMDPVGYPVGGQPVGMGSNAMSANPLTTPSVVPADHLAHQPQQSPVVNTAVPATKSTVRQLLGFAGMLACTVLVAIGAYHVYTNQLHEKSSTKTELEIALAESTRTGGTSNVDLLPGANTQPNSVPSAAQVPAGEGPNVKPVPGVGQPQPNLPGPGDPAPVKPDDDLWPEESDGGEPGNKEPGSNEPGSPEPGNTEPSLKPEIPEPGGGPTVEQPGPEPPALADLNSQQLADIDEALRKAAESMSKRKFDVAHGYIEQAEAIAALGAPGLHSDRIYRMGLLKTHAVEFWEAVKEGTALIAGQDLDVAGVIVHIQDANSDEIRYRRAGKNQVVAFNKLHVSMARAIAQKWLDDSASSHVFVGAFMAVEPGYPAAKAREQFMLAMSGGPPISDVASELLLVLDELP